MRVAVVGAGGLGGFYAGLLARGGLDVAVMARGRNLAALREQGLRVTLLSGEEVHVAVRATDDPSDIGPVDLAWFCVKTYDLADAARQALPLIGPATLVLPIQNGVEAAEHLAAILGRAHVLGGVARAGATLVAPGHIEQKAALAGMIFGELDGGASERTAQLGRLLARVGIEPRISQDIRVELWEKFVLGSAIFGLDGLLRLPLGTILERPALGELYRGLLRETAAVGRARGVPLPEAIVERHWEGLVSLMAENPSAHTSLYHDLVAGRRLELEAMGGAVVRLGREAGVPTPLHFAVYAALTPYAEGAASRWQ
jgi:2-dehydropantoate 2-reductase